MGAEQQADELSTEEIHQRIGELEAEIDRLEFEKEQLRHKLRDWQ